MIIESNESTTEEVILLAAENLFLEKGFALTSTADIARDSGCNSALIHYYFRTKERLFLSIFEKKMLLFVNNFFSLPLENSSFFERLEFVINTHFEFIHANKKLPFLLINEITTNRERMEQLREIVGSKICPMFELLQKEIDDEIEHKRIRNISAFDLMITIGTLNVSTFLILPVLSMVDGFDELTFIENRKKEILHTVLASLKYDTNE